MLQAYCLARMVRKVVFGHHSLRRSCPYDTCTVAPLIIRIKFPAKASELLLRSFSVQIVSLIQSTADTLPKMGGILACCALNVFECAACAACSCFTTALNWSMSQAARFSHFILILIVFIIAIVLGESYPEKFDGSTEYTSQVNLSTGCSGDYLDECIYKQLIYRASGALVILFIVLAILGGLSDRINRGFWILKLGATVAIFIGFWFSGNGFFNGWVEATRIISFFWLLVQGLLLLDFAHDIHELMMEAADEEEKKGNESRYIYAVYLLLSASALTAAIVGLCFLFSYYTGCGLGMFFTVLTLVVGVLTTIISLLNQVQRGLLTPCIMFAYSVFLCWYALLSNPEESCNPTADDVNGLKVRRISYM
jgi:serine incorporator 1/3